MILLLNLISVCFAITVDVIGPKSEIYIPLTNLEVNLDDNLGKISVDFFKQNNLIFLGSEAGITTINNLGNDIEIVSDTEMKAYGWCFSINGEVPETMSNVSFLTQQSDHLRWYYAYAHFKDGAWIAQCKKD